jgi:hypothetical protein
LNHGRVKANYTRKRFPIIHLAALLVGMSLMASGAVGAGLWVPNSFSLAEFQGVLKSGTTHAYRVNTSNDLDGSSSIAFDRNGDVWVTNFNSNSIVKFTNSQIKALKKFPAPSAVVIIAEDVGRNLDGPEGLAFDASGNMWVGSERGRQILMYTPAQLATSGNPTPNLILNAKSFSFGSPSNVVFDASRNLWVVDENIPNGNGGYGELFKYNAAQINDLKPGVQNLDPVFGIASSNFSHLEGLAFDLSGNLWVADEYASLIYKFPANQLGGTGLFHNFTPSVILSAISMRGPCTQSLDSPYGVAFNRKGNLFVSNAGMTGVQCSGSLALFSAKRITSSGSPAPKVFISSSPNGENLSSPNYLTFGPSLP